MTTRQLTNTVSRLYWRTAETHPEALAIGMLTFGALLGWALGDILDPITTELDALQQMSEARSSAADANA